MPDLNPTRIERKVDLAVTSEMPVSQMSGNIAFEKIGEMMEFAKLMAAGGVALPNHCRDNPGVCLAILNRAFRWRMDPYAVAEQTYLPPNSDRLAYMAQLVHAVVEAHAPLESRLRDEILGEGDERRCRVWGTLRGEKEPHSYTSETLKTLRDARGKNDRGMVKGSPLWVTQPEVQLRYSAYRQWARLYSPETLLGIYTPEEIDNIPRDVTPHQDEKKVDAFAQRLRDSRAAQAGKDQHGRGFDASFVEREVGSMGGSQTIEGKVLSNSAADAANGEEDDRNAIDHHDDYGREGDASDRRSGDDASGGADNHFNPARDDEGASGEVEARAEKEGDAADDLAPEDGPLGGGDEDGRVTRKGGSRKGGTRK